MNQEEDDQIREQIKNESHDIDATLTRIDSAIEHIESMAGDPVVEYRGKTDPERAPKSKVLEMLKWWKGELDSRICSREASNFMIYKIEEDRA